MDQVFLSYNRTDREACIALRVALEQTGLIVYRDEDVIRAGDRWMSDLEQALERCSAFVILVGRNGVRRWVAAEVQVALKRHLSVDHEAQRLAIFPVLLGDASPEGLPPFLTLFQAIRWSPLDPLPTGLIEAIKTRTTTFDAVHTFEGCPFLGLNVFRRRDAPLFFGRRKETLEALAGLGEQQQSNPEQLRDTGGGTYYRWLQIEGNSGTGKSSLVNAGMLPLIEQGALWARTGYERWRIIGPMVPGQDPLANLAEVLEQGLIVEPAQRNMRSRRKALSYDERALAFTLRDFKQDDTAFLLIIDQFEELFTSAADLPRKQFEALLAHALHDRSCPLFVISTVRADFLDRFEQLPQLQSIYNTGCKRYFLSTISEHGLRETIEQPARLAGLDVSEVTAAILDDAREEIGALPLVENCLFILWQQREGNRLSGECYRKEKGIAGMLSTQADAMLERIDYAVSGGRQAALELLLRLTRINDAGRHTRQRISRAEAVLVAGDGNSARGEQVVQLLSGGGRLPNHGGPTKNGALRLITTSEERREQYVDLIHETLIRTGSKDELGRPQGYWPTLYQYIEKNRDRDIHRQQLKLQTQRWEQCGRFARLWHLAGPLDLMQYRRLRVPKHSSEGRFLSRSVWRMAILFVLLLAGFGTFAESALWATKNNLPFGYTFVKVAWVLGVYHPFPEMVSIPAAKEPGGMAALTIGCVEAADANLNSDNHGGRPTTKDGTRFKIGKYEVTFLQYDYYIWDQKRKGNVEIDYAADAGFGRWDRPVINVSWPEAKAYAKWLAEKTGEHYGLPTEGLWEYAARAGTKTEYWWGDEFEKTKANCKSKRTLPVGSYAANPWGVYDTAGNVSEWVSDKSGSSPALRGGSWFDDSTSCGVTGAFELDSGDFRFDGFGFRACSWAPIE